VFFKIWAYRSSYTKRFGQLQPAPLFMGANPRVIKIVAPSNWITGGLVITAFALALGVAGIIVWWNSRSDKQSAARAKAKTLDLRF
jgi:hypothetical protein